MKNYIKILMVLCCICCSKKEENTAPVASVYIAPVNNGTCTGQVVANQNNILVTFEWSPFQDAQDATLQYTLVITEVSNNSVVGTKEVNNNVTQMSLEKGKVYTWQVTAKDSQGAAISGAVWTFQTPFEGTVNHAPFPANLVSPTNAQVITSNNITLNWEGNDPDVGETNQLTYDVYLGTNSQPEKVAEGVTVTSYSQEVTAGIYYWKIVSKDPSNQASNSQLHQFQVQ